MSPRFDPLPLLRAATALVAAVVSVACTAADPERFGIYVSRLDGQGVRRIVADGEREMNHARVSPDKQWITFTRYNKRGWNGLAKEEGGYMETEIMLVRVDGSQMQSLVAPRKDTVAANGYWTEDGRAILYVSNDNPGRRGQIQRIELATRSVTKVALAGDPWAADPHAVKGQMAISVFDPATALASIWLAEGTSGALRRVTAPKPAGAARTQPPLGDYDPKLSPDGRSLVAMRHVGKDNWHAVVVDLASGAERDLSAAKAVDGVPEWSSDGGKLVFWHVDAQALDRSGLYTVNPDGSERRRVPLPRGHFYTMPAFFPGEGSGSSARIVFSAEINPSL